MNVPQCYIVSNDKNPFDPPPDGVCEQATPTPFDEPEHTQGRMVTPFDEPSDLEPDEGQQEQGGNKDDSDTEGFKFTHVSDLIRDIKPTDWLIHGFLEAESLSVLFGESGTLKTFLTLSWGLSIACGTDWFGHKVKQGPVFFIIGEGQNGFARRVKAWEIEMDIDMADMPFYVSNAPIMMLDDKSAKAAGDAINILREKHRTPALVVIDTLARNFGPGDENSTADMTNFISNLDKYIGRDFSRMVVHHTGQGNKERARGSYALLAAADAEYCMAKNKGNIVLSCTKMKDSEKFSEMAFKPRTVTISNDYQHPMTSLVLDQVDTPKTKIKLSAQMEQALSILKSMQQCGAKDCRICLSQWRDKCVEEKVYARQSFYRAIETMRDRGIIVISEEYVKLS